MFYLYKNVCACIFSAVTIAPALHAPIVPRRTRNHLRIDHVRVVLRIDTDTMYDGEGATRVIRTRVRLDDIYPLDSNKCVKQCCIYVHKMNIRNIYNCIYIV